MLTPAAAEALDLLKATATAGELIYVFPPGQGAPNVWNLRRHVSKSAAAPVVCDAQRRRPAIRGAGVARAVRGERRPTNTSTIRLETHALFNVERIGAAVRIAAS